MKKTPFITLEQERRISEKFPTPYHLYDEKGIRENARKLREAFAWNPGFKEYFAVKATPNPPSWRSCMRKAAAWTAPL
jgi:diaminopimelate decarboxylase